MFERVWVANNCFGAFGWQGCSLPWRFCLNILLGIRSKTVFEEKGGGKFRMWLNRVVSDILGCVLEVWYVFGGLGIHGEPF